ncbi:MAG: flagellar export chaperone FliS [Planctomycetota bacterium]
MLTQPSAARRYHEAQILNATPVKLICLLYAGAQRFLEKGETAMQNRNRAEAGNQINRAMAVIGELKASLDRDKGGQIAADLERLYQFVLAQCLEANLRQNPQNLQAARQILMPLQEGFETIARQQAGLPPTPPQA